MADQATSDRVGEKFEAWAGSLSGDEQEALAQWLSKVGGGDVEAYGANWWQADNAWSNVWNSWAE